MKKFLNSMKKGIVLLTTLLLFSIPVTAYAAQEDYLGDKAGKTLCTVTFYFIDETGGYPGKNINAIMEDEGNGLTDKYGFTPANSWNSGNTPKYSVIAPAAYNVTFEGLEDGYAIVNTLDFSSDIKIEAAPDGSVDVYWSIISTVTDWSREGNVSESRLLGGERHDIENEEPEQVYQAFLEQVEFIAEDDTWYNFLKIYKTFSHEEWYGKYVNGGKAEDYMDMSLFDRFIWDETYLRFCNTLNSGDSNMFFGNEDKFRRLYLDTILDCMTGDNNEQVKNAYETLAMWQYNYITENGVPFNFINNRSYIEEIGEEKAAETAESLAAEQKEQAARDEKELREAREELLNDMDKADIDALRSEGADVSAGSPAITILVVVCGIIVLIAVAMLVIRNRKK